MIAWRSLAKSLLGHKGSREPCRVRKKEMGRRWVSQTPNLAGWLQVKWEMMKPLAQATNTDHTPPVCGSLAVTV